MKPTLLLIAIALFSTAVSAQSNYSPETLAKIKEVENNIYGGVIINNAPPSTIAQRMAKYKVKGMSIAVIQDHKIVWAKGYGWADEAEKRPVTTETLFEPGSISKSLNAIGILKLAQDKKLDLYTDINTYLTSWRFPYDSVSHGKKITLAQILSHTAGLSVHGFPGHNINGSIPTVYQVLDGLSPAVTAPVRSELEPGLKFQYAGGGTTISQVILTDITRQPYEVWMYDNVLKPIGMVHSSYAQPPSKDMQPLCASAYYKDGTPVLNKYHVYPEQAAAGLWMTPSDLCQYIIDMQLAYQGHASKVLNTDMVKLHLTLYNNEETSMGSFIQDHNGAKYFEHGAGNDGFCGDFYGSLDEGYGVAIFLNSEDGHLLYDVINAVAKVYNWKNFYREPKHIVKDKTIAVSDSILKNYEGIYLYDNQWAAVGKRNNEYHFFANDMCAKMFYTTATSFYNEEFAAVKTFIKDDRGIVTGYTRTVDGKEFPAAKKIMNIDTVRLDGSAFNDIGWYLFENKQYKESLAYFRRGAELFPQDLNLAINMGHVYLYDNDYQKALAIYRKYLKGDIKPGHSFESQMQDDLIYFEDHHFDVKPFDKVFTELNIKKPKGY